MWSDNETDIDLLGFHHLKTAVLSVVNNEELSPATIGIFGDWGSGKSSLMKMACEELENEENEELLVLSFNGWQFEGYEDAKTALMGTIIDEIIAKRTIGANAKETAKRLGLKLIKKIHLFRLLGIGGQVAMAYATGGATMAGAALVASGTSYVTEEIDRAKKALDEAESMDVGAVQDVLKSESGNSLRRSIRDFRDDFEEFLEQTEVKTLVVLIDDLDRCMPDTIIETLEAIKLFLFVPRTVFVIGADERLVRYAVRKRFPELPGEKVEVGQDYLEKLIQYPVRVPPLGRTEMETYINLLFTQKAGITGKDFEAARECVTNCSPDNLLEVKYNHAIAQKIMGENFPKELGENLALAQRISPILATGLMGNPRQCKRFLNTLMMRIEMAKSRGIELKPGVLAKLMLLERFYSESYKQLAKAQAEQAGKPSELAKIEKESKKETDADISEWLSDPALSEWIASEPPLANEDLRPYFYFSRDKLGPMGNVIQRMSPIAQEILSSILDKSKAQRNNAVKRAAELGQGDAASVLEALAEKARLEDDMNAEDSALNGLILWMEARSDQFGQGISFLSNFSEEGLPVSIPPKLLSIASSEGSKSMVKQLLQKWGSSTNSRLKSAANNILKKI